MLIEKGLFCYNLTYILVDARRNLKRAIDRNKNCDYFIIDINGEVAGEIDYEDIIPELKAKLGYWLSKNFKGRGIMSRSLKLSNSYVFKKYNLRRIYRNVRAGNKSSIKVLEKFGFKLEGIQKKSFLKNKKYSDEYIYAKVK